MEFNKKDFTENLIHLFYDRCELGDHSRGLESKEFKNNLEKMEKILECLMDDANDKQKVLIQELSGIKNTFKVTKAAVPSVHNIIGIGGALILLVVISLFLGIFSALSDDSSVNSAILPIIPEVLAYSDTVVKYAKEYELEDYIGVINMVMMLESSGKDPMQSSECEYNEKYPNRFLLIPLLSYCFCDCKRCKYQNHIRKNSYEFFKEYVGGACYKGW